MRPTFALASDDVTIVVIGSANVTITRLAPIGIFLGQAIVLIQALVTISANDKPLASTVSCHLITTIIGDYACYLTCTL